MLKVAMPIIILFTYWFFEHILKEKLPLQIYTLLSWTILKCLKIAKINILTRLTYRTQLVDRRQLLSSILVSSIFELFSEEIHENWWNFFICEKSEKKIKINEILNMFSIFAEKKILEFFQNIFTFSLIWFYFILQNYLKTVTKAIVNL